MIASNLQKYVSAILNQNIYIKKDQASMYSSRKSIVYFKAKEGGGNLLFPEFGPLISNMADVAPEIFNDTIVKTSSSEIEKGVTVPVPLIGARNSLELVREKSIMHHHEEGMGILGVRDSLQKHRMSIKPNATNQDLLRNIFKPPSFKDFLDETISEIASEFGGNRRMSRMEDQPRRVSLKPTNPEVINLNTDEVSDISELKKDTVMQESNKPSSSENMSLRKASISDNNKIECSKLGMSRDSLELIRSQSKLLNANQLKGLQNSKESVEIKHGIINLNTDEDKGSFSKTKLNDDSSRMVRMSFVEIVGIDEPEVSSKRASLDSPWNIYSQDSIVEKDVESYNVARENFLTKPNIAGVEGDQTGKEHMQTAKEFTIHRAESFMSIFKKHPSLMKMFTSCTK